MIDQPRTAETPFESDSTLIQTVVRLVDAGFLEFLDRFNSVTAGAREHFAAADFHAIQADTKYRLRLYKDTARKIAVWVSQRLGSRCTDRDLWLKIRDAYSVRMRRNQAHEIAQTWFNSVVRKVEGSPYHEVIYVYPEEIERHSEMPIYKRHWAVRPVEEIIRRVLTDADLGLDWEDLERDIRNIARAVETDLLSRFEPDRKTRVEVLRSIFYRNKAAYIIGRFIMGGRTIPMVLPILHGKEGLYVDALVDDPNEVSIIFSFSRSYFLVNTAIPSELVAFLKTLIPLKNEAELYSSIGFNKHGKTELYRDFVRHLARSKDEFVVAPGIRGMVMAVFTLPSYPIVFKLIKDRFEPPKNVTHTEVKSAYKLVSEHDRVGRMADTHEFGDLHFPRNRFSKDLLSELQEAAPSLLTITANEVIIHHLYTERKMLPLNLYLENATVEEAEHAVSEYGNAIKQLAAANIFPGDMLLKNFGVTRHNRVIFYDYDEIVFLTDCNFRRIPEPRDDYQAMSGEVWYSVGPNDIFPEEFTKFLIGRADIRVLFHKLHGEIFGVTFWKSMQEAIRKGQIVTVFPYRRRRRFEPDRPTL